MSNDRIILDQVLDQKRADLAPTLSPSDFFEVFAAEQILKDYDLSYDEIESGIVGDGGDGGIDGIYVFTNGDLVQEDTDFAPLKKHVTLELVIVQAKTSAGFSETPIDKFIAASEDLLDLSKSIASLKTTYNERLLEGIQRFRSAHTTLATVFPKIKIEFYYASKGDEVHPNVAKKAEKLRAKVRQLFSDAEVEVEFLGAVKLLSLARRSPKTTYSLTLAETPISSTGDVGFVCLVRLRDYFKFITDEKGNLLRGIFEANVRDYQGRTEVNDGIQASLQEAHEDFWWLNNGISIIAAKATQSGKTLTIEDPQIVNGLQSSTEIYNYFKKSNTTGDDRNLLVRVIVPAKPDSRDRIIKATNSQTYIQPASLRATDKIHRDIEEYLKTYGLYYDRRKNHYKNEGKAIERIIGIPYMAQAVMSIALQRPDIARARPSSLLKKDEDYAKLFAAEHPIAMYKVCAEIVKACEAHLRALSALSAKDRSNIQFHVAMVAAALAAGKLKPSYGDLSSLDPAGVTPHVLVESTDLVFRIYEKMGASDQVAKSLDFASKVLSALGARMAENTPAAKTSAAPF